MELTELQKKAKKIAIDRYLNKQKYVVISGFAGSGKSTSLSSIMEGLKEYGVDPQKDVCYTALSGKATLVLSAKGCKNTSTLHKLLYDVRVKDGETHFEPKPSLEKPYKIIVVDEVSMVPFNMMKDLAKHNVFTICLGDNYQLPAIFEEDDNHLLDVPHIFLNEIHRQAADSEIIKLTMNIRKQQPLQLFDGKDVKVINKSQLTIGMLQWADIVICAMNKTRKELNSLIIQSLGLKVSQPQDGVKVICTSNYWDIFDNESNSLINGTIGYLKNCVETTISLPYKMSIKRGEKKKCRVLKTDLVTEYGTTFKNLYIDMNGLISGEPSYCTKTMIKIKRNCPEILPLVFDYGYAISCHKSQGSQWDKVLVIEEYFPYKREEHSRWLYTACTRSSSRLVIAKR